MNGFRLLTTSLFVFALVGCVGVRTGKPTRSKDLTAKTRGRLDLVKPAHWKRVALGEPPKLSLLGYLRTERGTHWVYDQGFELVGTISPRGATVRFRDGRERAIGNLPTEIALLKLFYQPEKGTITLQRMHTPRR